MALTSSKGIIESMTAFYSYQEVRQKLRKLWGEQKYETDKRFNVRLMSKELTLKKAEGKSFEPLKVTKERLNFTRKINNIKAVFTLDHSNVCSLIIDVEYVRCSNLHTFFHIIFFCNVNKKHVADADLLLLVRLSRWRE